MMLHWNCWLAVGASLVANVLCVLALCAAARQSQVPSPKSKV